MIPQLDEFNPSLIPFQYEVIKHVRLSDYKNGVEEILLSGSVGSAKSLLMAHLAITHCLLYKKANVLIGRKSLPSLRDTLLQMIVDHIGVSVSYEFNQTRGSITFPNGSRIFCYSWSDKKYKKVRSYALSMACIEELTENEDGEFYKEILMRLNRVNHIKEKVIICATNPDSPSHWAYQWFIEKPTSKRKVFYSKTDQNPFIDQAYISSLREMLSPKEARRMLEGEWLELIADIVYYNYSSERNFLKNTAYVVNSAYPIDLMFDFNIGVGKPMSCALGQYINEQYHVFDKCIINGARTLDILEELHAKGKICQGQKIRIFGDASGRHNDTRNIKSDYEIIKRFMVNNITTHFEECVPLANPALRLRHNLVNASFLNDNKKVSFFIYQGCEDVDKGFRLTKLRDRANYVEDDSFEFQHITTAIGYWICENNKIVRRGTPIVRKF